MPFILPDWLGFEPEPLVVTCAGLDFCRLPDLIKKVYLLNGNLSLPSV
jgi:hypothetical protein